MPQALENEPWGGCHPCHGEPSRKVRHSGPVSREGSGSTGSLTRTRSGICLCDPRASGWGALAIPLAVWPRSPHSRAVAALRDVIADCLRREAAGGPVSDDLIFPISPVTQPRSRIRLQSI